VPPLPIPATCPPKCLGSFPVVLSCGGGCHPNPSQPPAHQGLERSVWAHFLWSSKPGESHFPVVPVVVGATPTTHSHLPPKSGALCLGSFPVVQQTGGESCSCGSCGGGCHPNPSQPPAPQSLEHSVLAYFLWSSKPGESPFPVVPVVVGATPAPPSHLPPQSLEHLVWAHYLWSSKPGESPFPVVPVVFGATPTPPSHLPPKVWSILFGLISCGPANRGRVIFLWFLWLWVPPQPLPATCPPKSGAHCLGSFPVVAFPVAQPTGNESFSSGSCGV